MTISITEQEYQELMRIKREYEKFSLFEYAHIPKIDYEYFIAINEKYEKIFAELNYLLNDVRKHKLSLIDYSFGKRLEELLK